MNCGGPASGFNDRPRPALEEIGGSGVVHDLGNLIQIAMSALTIIGRSPHLGHDTSLEPTLTRARKALDQAGALVRQTMDRTRETSLVVRKISELHDVAVCLNEILPLVQWICEPDIDLSIDLPADLPLMRCSSIDLQNAVLNLVINARDAMPQGGSLGLTVRCASKQGEIEIRVADDGTGMSQETLRWALSPFFTTKPQGYGTGLGLAMTQRFVQEAGGRLEIVSAPGAGTTVAIRLPC
jgi:signal transduction histidine kinase